MRSSGGDHVLKEQVPRDKEIAVLRAAKDKDIVRVRQPVPERAHAGQQSFGLCDVNRQDPQVVPDLFELRPRGGVRGQQEFLKDDRIHREANAALGFGGKQLRRGGVPTQVSKDHVRVQEHQGTFLIGVRVLFPFPAA